MNRAAEHVGRSQSAVSQQMRKLEQKLGHRLFRKQGRGLELTEAGQLLLIYARRMLALNASMRRCGGWLKRPSKQIPTIQRTISKREIDAYSFGMRDWRAV